MSGNVSKHAFGSKDNVAAALANGTISARDIIFMEGSNGTGEIAWVNTSGQIVYATPTITTKTKNEWAQEENNSYVPAKGELVVYSDYQQKIENGVTYDVPSIKIGDGVNPVRLLMFVAGSTSSSVSKLEHTLTIGTHTFDGTADVSIPVYDGESN